MAKRLKPLGTTRLGTTPAPDGVGLLVSRIVLVAVPRLSVLCCSVSLNDIDNPINTVMQRSVIMVGHDQMFIAG